MDIFKKIQKSGNPLETARLLLAPLCKKKTNNYIKNCALCSTNHKDRDISYGNPNANILIISDYATDIQEYKDYFKSLLNDSEIDQKDLFFINSVNCVCKRSDGAYRMPSLEEMTKCKRYAKYCIEFVKPRIIISMGATTLNQFTPDNVNIIEHIDNATSYMGIKTLITYSIRDLYNFSELDTENELDNKVNKVVDTFNKAQRYIDFIRKEE